MMTTHCTQALMDQTENNARNQQLGLSSDLQERLEEISILRAENQQLKVQRSALQICLLLALHINCDGSRFNVQLYRFVYCWRYTSTVMVQGSTFSFTDLFTVGVTHQLWWFKVQRSALQICLLLALHINCDGSRFNIQLYRFVYCWRYTSTVMVQGSMFSFTDLFTVDVTHQLWWLFLNMLFFFRLVCVQLSVFVMTV